MNSRRATRLCALNGFKGAGAVAIFVKPPDDQDEKQPTLARRSPFAPAKKLCPKCLAPLQGGGGLGGWLIPMNYYCKKCGYSGTVFIEQEQQPEKGKS